jgi:hypothetical protein
MSDPRDRRLFALVSAVVSDGLAVIERAIAQDRQFARYDAWATIKWLEGGMPDFDFVGTEAPVDYKDAFNPLWGMFTRLGGSNAEEFDFETIQPYQQLKQYIRSVPNILQNFFPPDRSESMFGTSVKVFVEYLIDRYIHVTGQKGFDSDKFLPVYLPLEAGLLLEKLPIEIVVPILLVSLSSDSYELADGIEVYRMPKPLQLARAIRAHGTHEVNEYLLHQASHALILRDYVLGKPTSTRYLFL